MKAALRVVVLCLLASIPALADEQGFQDALLDRFAGSWVLRGSIDGNESVHDVLAEWVLEHQYLRFHEVAREKDSNGRPLYEAIVFIGWDQPSHQYACLWLDSTGGSGLSSQAIGYAKPSGDELPFVFDTGDGGVIHTTFAYSREADSWRWTIDIARDGKRSQFAQVVLKKE
jgi:hypothetical protein